MLSFYVMCGAQEKDAVQLTLEQIDVVRCMCASQDFELVTSDEGVLMHLLKGVHIFTTNLHFWL